MTPRLDALPSSIAAIDARADADLARMNRAAARLHPARDSEDGPLLQVAESGAVEPVEPTFVVHTYLPRGVVTMLNAPGGLGKTTLALGIAACIACGRPFGSHAVEQGRCLIVSLEDEGGQLAFQLRNVIAAAGLDGAMVAQRVVIADGAADDVSLAHETRDGELIGDAALAQLAELAHGYALVVIDGVGDALRGNKNAEGIVRDFIRRKLGRIAREANCAILLIGHVDKAGMRHGTGGQSFIGSVEFNNSARSRLAIVERDGRLWLDQEKSNRAAKAPPLALRQHPGGALLPCEGGVSGESGADDLVLLHCMANAIARGEIIGTARAGACTAWTLVRTLPGFPTSMGAAAFWRALGRLEERGALVREEYTNANRKVRQRWSVAPNAPNCAE